jgi:large subunit ribosomal protein L25
MVKAEIPFQAHPRELGAKSNNTRLREEGMVPAVVYADGKPAVAVSLNEHDFNMMLHRHHGENLMIDLKVGDSPALHVLIKEIQHHPMTSRVLHVDFQSVSLDRKIKIHLPLNLTGTPIGVSRNGGTLDIQFRNIEVECKASDIIEELDVDVSAMELGEHLTADKIVLPAGYRLITPKHISVAAVLEPRVATEDEAAAAPAAAEPEKIVAKKKEEVVD